MWRTAHIFKSVGGSARISWVLTVATGDDEVKQLATLLTNMDAFCTLVDFICVLYVISQFALFCHKIILHTKYKTVMATANCADNTHCADWIKLCRHCGFTMTWRWREDVRVGWSDTDENGTNVGSSRMSWRRPLLGGLTLARTVCLTRFRSPI
jgi:hypothetical protein